MFIRSSLFGFLLGTTAALLLSMISMNANAYQVAPVSNGGKITGTISLKGKPLPPKSFKIEKTPEVCGEDDRILEEVRVKNGKLADVVVLLEKVAKGKPFVDEESIDGPPPGERMQKAGSGSEFPGTTIKPKECIFGAFTGVVAAGKLMRFRNGDPVKHSPHGYGVKGRVRKTMFNQDLGGDGQIDLKVKFKGKKTKVVKLECDQHNHMQNWFRAVENPYYAFSTDNGTFVIDQVPPGEYKLIAWHPKFKKELKKKITVAANGSVTADFEFKSKVK